MNLHQALSLAEDKLRALIRQEKERLIAEIKAMRRQHAAKGLLQSGATLKRVCDLGIESQTRRIDTVFSVVKSAIESVEPPVTDLSELLPTIAKFLPEHMDDPAEHIRKAVAAVNVPNALPQLLDAIANARANEIQKAETDFRLLLLKSSATLKTNQGQLLGLIEGISLLVTVGLAILWIKNPSGPYEPYLVLVGAIVTAGSFLQKRFRRGG